MTVIDTPEGIAFYQLLARRGSLRLELRGIRRSSRGQTSYSIAKQAYGLKGSRASVLAQLTAMIDRVQLDRERAACAGFEHSACRQYYIDSGVRECVIEVAS